MTNNNDVDDLWFDPEARLTLLLDSDEAFERAAEKVDPDWKDKADRLVAIFAHDLTKARRYMLKHARPSPFEEMGKTDSEPGYILRRLVFLAADGEVIRAKRGTDAILSLLAQLNCDHLKHPVPCEKLLRFFRSR